MTTGLVAIMGAALVALVGRGLTSWRRVEAELQQLFGMERGLNRLGEELRNGLALADRPFQGKVQEMAFLTAPEPTRLVQVRYRLETEGQSQSLVYEQIPFPPAPEEEGAAPPVRTVLPRVTKFGVEYGTLGEGQKTVRWSKTWEVPPQPNTLPKLLRVEIKAEDSQGKVHSLTREFHLPQGGLGKPSEG